jgi:heme/copper-type cytochrome/quinol oxidase subunit 2
MNISLLSIPAWLIPQEEVNLSDSLFVTVLVVDAFIILCILYFVVCHFIFRRRSHE